MVPVAVLQATAVEILLELALNILRQFPPVRGLLRPQRRVVLGNELIQEGRSTGCRSLPFVCGSRCALKIRLTREHVLVSELASCPVQGMTADEGNILANTPIGKPIT